MSYLYDAFFSYKRDTQSDFWHQMVKDKLAHWLRVELGQPEVKIFFDTEEIHTGDRWRQKIAHALTHSKCLVCVWSPYYFQSKYCVSEWLPHSAISTRCKA
jgi:TIR domain